MVSALLDASSRFHAASSRSTQDLFLRHFSVWSAPAGLIPSGGIQKTRVERSSTPSRARAANSSILKQQTGPVVLRLLHGFSSKKGSYVILAPIDAWSPWAAASKRTRQGNR